MILDLLINTLNKPKSLGSYSKSNYEFNCPDICKSDNYDEVDNKYNLNVNLPKQVFKCWKCGYHGSVNSLLKKYGDRDSLKKYQEYNFAYVPEVIKEKTNWYISLPKEIVFFKNLSEFELNCNKYWLYLINERKLNRNKIFENSLGYCDEGFYSGRIIIPSYNEFNWLNTFIARSIDDKLYKPTYLGPNVVKNEIIFNENKINWNHPLVLVEGPMDYLSISCNITSLLGKILTKKLKSKILKYKTPIIIMIDQGEDKDSKIIENELLAYDIDVKVINKQIYKDANSYLENDDLKSLKKIILNEIPN